MTERAFFDTNILVYIHDTRYPHKQEVAAGLLQKHLSDGSACISTQVLQELYVALTTKVGRLRPAAARELLGFYLAMNVVTVQPAQILHAIEIQSRYRAGFWDSLILAAAKSSRSEVLFTEDLSHGQVYEGVRVTNPFRKEGV